MGSAPSTARSSLHRLPSPAFQPTDRASLSLLGSPVRLVPRQAPPSLLSAAEVEAFLNHLAVKRRVSASIQSQALNAVVFLYDAVLSRPLGEMAGLKRGQQRHRVPVVLTREEVKAVLSLMEGTSRLMAELIYGAGLRVHERVTHRAKYIDLSAKTVSVRDSRGSKDRTTVLPEQPRSPLEQHPLQVAVLHKENLPRGAGLAPMPDARCPMPDARCPMPDARCPMPDARCPMPWPESIRLSPRPLSGSSSFPLPPSIRGGIRADWFGGMHLIQPFSAPSSEPSTRRGFASTQAFIACGIVSPCIYWQPGPTFGQFSYYLATAACRPP